jgi:hypothetical protein
MLKQDNCLNCFYKYIISSGNDMVRKYEILLKIDRTTIQI